MDWEKTLLVEFADVIRKINQCTRLIKYYQCEILKKAVVYPEEIGLFDVGGIIYYLKQLVARNIH